MDLNFYQVSFASKISHSATAWYSQRCVRLTGMQLKAELGIRELNQLVENTKYI